MCHQIVELRDVYLAAHDPSELLADIVAGLAHQAQAASRPVGGGARCGAGATGGGGPLGLGRASASPANNHHGVDQRFH
jgi:hypothetical protein